MYLADCVFLAAAVVFFGISYCYRTKEMGKSMLISSFASIVLFTVLLMIPAKGFGTAPTLLSELPRFFLSDDFLGPVFSHVFHEFGAILIGSAVLMFGWIPTLIVMKLLKGRTTPSTQVP